MKKIKFCFFLLITVTIFFIIPSCNNSVPKVEKNISDILEQSISSVFTVKINSDKKTKTAFGYANRDSSHKSISEIAYAQSLNIEGAKAIGSGFIINSEDKKYLITNAHVIETVSDISKDVTAVSYSRKEYKLLFVGADSFYDIAVFEISEPLDSNIVPLTFTSNNYRIGEKVFAVGNPLGNYPYTVTEGIISALNRPGLTAKSGYLQSSALISHGNSGGPLINEKGELVGINTAGIESNSQLNFALESKVLERILPDLINKGRVERVFFGLEICKDYTYEINDKGEIKIITLDEKPRINTVVPNSPASSLNNLVNKYITRVNDVEVASLADLLTVLEKIKPNEKVTFELQDNNGVPEKVELTTGILSEEKLDEIAKYYFKYHYNIELTNNESGVIMNYPSGFQYRTFQFYDKNSAKFSAFAPSGHRSYIVSCGNFFTKDDYELWSINNYKDLGNALRLAAMNGTISFVDYDGKRGYLIRVLLKTRENIMGKTLLY